MIIRWTALAVTRPGTWPALTSLGQPLSYVMEGGFKARAAAELEGASEYDASTGAVLSTLSLE